MPTVPVTVTEESTPPPEGAAAPTSAALGPDDALVSEELLVEDVSIDGMCGVY